MKNLPKLRKYLLFLTVTFGIFSLSSCASTNLNPKDLIIDNYGDKEFKISFSSYNLDEPINDVIYTANNIPKLPTPTKVGYRFLGWYFDETYTKQYDEDYLLMKMNNVTLYAKFQEEEFINNGIYEIEYEAHILEDTIIKGKLADTYGYLEFPSLINSDETYIEKNENGLFLRIQYDMKYHCPTIDDEGNLGTLTVAVADNDSRISDTESIIDRTGTIETIYYDFKDLKISNSVYLNVEFYNWNAKLKDENDRAYTKVGYTVEFKITKFIGYTTSYVDNNDRLDDGYYLVKTHYANLNKAATMLDSFNPVYSYLYAKNGNYKLIKPMNTYNSDIIGDLSKEDYNHVRTGFSRDFTYFAFDNSIIANEEDVNDNFANIDWAKYFNAQKFGDLTYEFNKNTGIYYYTFDLGNKANVDLILIGASTGAMTEMFNMGPTYKRLVIDYSSMVKLSSVDYTPLSGNSYSYKETQAFYLYTDFDSLKDNTIYDAEKTYGMSNDLVNIFYSSTDGKKINELYSTKVTIKPITTTSIQENKGNIFTFEVINECYGYDPTVSKTPLYADYISWTTFSTYSQRFTKRIELGYEASENEYIDIYSLFRNKINSDLLDEKLKYKAYKLKSNNEIDYTSTIDLNVTENNTFKYTQNIAIYLSGEINGKTINAMISIINKEDPVINIDDSYEYNDEDFNYTWTYDNTIQAYKSSKTYYKDDKVHIPEIKYTSYGNIYTSLDSYNSINNCYFMNFSKISIYNFNSSNYKKISYNYEVWNTSMFNMSSDTMVVIYRLIDRYGYSKNLTFMYEGQNKGTYEILKNDEQIYSGNQYYYSDGTRREIKVNNLDAKELTSPSEEINAQYEIKIGENKYELNLDKFTCYTKENTIEGTTAIELENALSGSNYALIYFEYSHDKDIYTTYLTYNLKINGKNYSDFSISNNKEFFTNTNYTFNELIVMDIKGINLSTSYPNFKKYSNGYYTNIAEQDMTKSNSTYTFLTSGKYRISYSLGFVEDENEESVFLDGNKTITIQEDIVVHSLDEEITLTYKTDRDHPFRSDLPNVVTLENGDQTYTTTIKQSKENLSLNSTYFENSEDNLYMWAYYKKSGKTYDYLKPRQKISNIGAKLNTTTPLLVAVWDKGLTVTAKYTINGVTQTIKTKTYFKSNGKYTFSLGDFVFNVPSGCSFIGWRCDKKVFYDVVGGEKNYSNETSYTNDMSFEFDESITIEAIIKEPIKLKFYSYNYNGTNELKELQLPNYSALEDQLIKESLTSAQYNLVKKQESKDKFKYWAIYHNGELTKINSLDELKVSKSYFEDNYFKIVAVFGD